MQNFHFLEKVFVLFKAGRYIKKFSKFGIRDKLKKFKRNPKKLDPLTI
jgi:hypothetical protein